jgi:hypothetical protein
MSETVFSKVDYDLGSLVKYIALGEIGLPDIQRPFVWKNALAAVIASFDRAANGGRCGRSRAGSECV